MEVTFPNGVDVRAVGISERAANSDWRSFGLYLDSRWAPNWPSIMIEWPDFGLPDCWTDASTAIQRTYERAAMGEHVEIGCIGGLGRTGTVLACMAILSGVAPNEAVNWVRTHYDPRAVETAKQEEWVHWFADRPQLCDEPPENHAT